MFYVLNICSIKLVKSRALPSNLALIPNFNSNAAKLPHSRAKSAVEFSSVISEPHHRGLRRDIVKQNLIGGEKAFPSHEALEVEIVEGICGGWVQGCDGVRVGVRADSHQLLCVGRVERRVYGHER